MQRFWLFVVLLASVSMIAAKKAKPGKADAKPAADAKADAKADTKASAALATASPAPVAAPAGGGGGGPSKDFRYECPTGKPVVVYGHTMNGVAVLEKAKDLTWTPDNVYLLKGPVSIKGALTVQAGTVVCFAYADFPVGMSANPPPGSISFEEKSVIKILGTKEKHVIFTAAPGKKTYWGGMYWSSGSRTDESTVQWLDVYNAGQSGSGPAIGTFPDDKAPPLDYQNVTFYSLQRKGLENLTSGFTAETRIVVNNYSADTEKRDFFGGYPVLRVKPYGAHTVTADTIKIGDSVPKAVRYIQLDHAEGMNIDKDVVLHKLDKDLAWRNIGNMKMNGYEDDPPTFKIDPGVTVAVNNSGYISIGNGGGGGGNIQAIGTAKEPVTFTSDAPMYGKDPDEGEYWPAIEFYPNNFCPSAPWCKAKRNKDKVSTFDHVIFEYGGSMGKSTIYNCNDGRSDRTAMILFTISGSGQDYEGPTITNSVFRFSKGAGVRARCNVGHSGGCLLTNYEDPKFNNKFEGFDAKDDRPATTPLMCPN